MGRKIWVLCAAALVMAGCGGDGDGGGDSAEHRDDHEHSSEVVNQDHDRRISVEVRGARHADFTGVSKVKVLTRTGEGAQLDASVAAIEVLDKIDVGGGLVMKPEVAVVGMYDKDGTFTLPAGIGPPPTTGPTVPGPGGTPSSVSVAAVTFTSPGPPPEERRFGYLLKPCKVVLRVHATEGSADCPELVAVNGEKVSLKFRWGKP